MLAEEETKISAGNQIIIKFETKESAQNKERINCCIFCNEKKKRVSLEKQRKKTQ